MNNPLISVLEPRLLFDGAAVATAVEVLDENSFEQDKEQHSKEEPTLDENSNSNDTKIAFVDSNLKDVDTIVNDLQESSMEVKLIDDKQDSIKQILDGLSDNKTYDEIHIFSHGSKGEITLGNSVINSNNIDNFKDDLNEISTKLNSGADILLYGCEIAKDDISKKFVDKLASFTKADIATSDDLTGSDTLNANWTLEYSTGEIQAETIVIENYDEVLSNAPDLSTSKLINDISPNSLSDPSAYDLFDDDINTNFQTSKGGAFTFSVNNSYISIDTITFTTTTFLNSTSNDLSKFALYGSKDGLTYDDLVYENNSLNPPASRGADYPVENINSSEPYGYYKIRFKNAVNLFEDIQLSGMKITGEEFTYKSYTENESKIQILDDANINDTDSGNLQTAKIFITEGFTTGDILAFNNNDSLVYGSITSSYNSSTGELNLSGSATLQQYENALKAVTYHSTSDAPTINSANRTFSWQVNDGTNDSNVTKSYLSITAVNDAPQLTVVDGIGNIQEDGVLSDSGSLSLVDVDEADTTNTISSLKSISGVQSDGSTALTLTTAQESALDKLSLIAGNSSNETIQWDYTVSQSDVDFIGEGERVTVVYTITSEDNNGASVSKEIEIEIVGANDEPTLIVNNVNADIEEGSGNLNKSGSIDYEDKDSTDIVTASLNSIAVQAYREDGSLYSITTEQEDELKNAFSLVDTGGSNKGSIQWEYNITEDKIDFLAKDEKVVLKYEIDIKDSNGGDKKEEVEVEITGTNDSPTLTINDGIGNIQEDGVLSDSGSLSLVDVDEADTTNTISSLKSISGVQSDGSTALTLTTAQESALDKLSLIAGNSSNETIQWDYTVSQSDVDFIGEGERVTVVYTITSEDNNGASVSKEIEIEIVGANDEPTLIVNNVNADIEEGSGNLNKSGSIDYEDKDSTDIVTASLNSIAVQAYREDGSLYSITTEQEDELKNAFSLVDTGGSNKGSIQWEYNITEDKIDFLAKDEKVVLKYEIDIKDSNGGDKKEEVEVEITGTNDSPTLTINDGIGNIQEDGVLSDSGSLSLVDVDEADTTNTISSLKSISGVQSDGSTALTLTTAQESALDKLSLTAGNSSNETIQWDYTVSQSDVDFIGEGERVTVVYTITSEDNNGASVSKEIEIEIVGANDEPTLIVNNVNADIEEGSGNLNKSGSIDYEDKDSTDIVTASLNSIAVQAYREDGSLYSITTEQEDELKNAFSLVDTGGSNKGSIQWEYNITEDKIDFLAKDEKVVLKYEIDIKDSNGGDKKEEVEVEITGTNDSPTLTINDGIGNIQEDGVLSDSGSLTLLDVDISNNINVEALTKSINAYYSDGSIMVLNSLRQEIIVDAFTLTTNKINDTQSNINWNFNIKQSDLSFLAENEKIDVEFTVKISDNESIVDTKDIFIEIQGANDTPTITSKDDIGELKESLTLSNNGFINLNDLDESNKLDTVLTASTIESYKKDGTALELTTEEKEYLINALELDSSGISNNSGTLTWNYEVDETQIDFLSEDEKVKITYTVQISDGFTSINEDIEINITGTNDKPTIISNENLDVYKIHNGIFNKDYSAIFTDIDRTDFLTYEFEGLPKGLSYDSSTGIVSGKLLEIGTFNISIKAYDNSALQESISKDFTMKVLGEEPGPRVDLEYIDNSTGDLEVGTIRVENMENERVEGVLNDNEEIIYEVGKGFIDEQNQLQELNIVENTKTNIIKDAKIVISDNGQIELNNYLNQNYDSLGITIEEISYKDEFIEFKIKDSIEALRYEVFVINEKQNDRLPIDIKFDEATGILRVQTNVDVKIAFKAITQSNERVLILDIQNSQLKEIENSKQESLTNGVSFKGELEKRDLENENYGDKIVGLFQETKA